MLTINKDSQVLDYSIKQVDDVRNVSFHGNKFNPKKPTSMFIKHGIISCTLDIMTKIMGFEPEYDEYGLKSHFIWKAKWNGIKFTIYDWKVDEDDIDFYHKNDIGWHIGSLTEDDMLEIEKFLLQRLREVENK